MPIWIKLALFLFSLFLIALLTVINFPFPQPLVAGTISPATLIELVKTDDIAEIIERPNQSFFVVKNSGERYRIDPPLENNPYVILLSAGVDEATLRRIQFVEDPSQRWDEIMSKTPLIAVLSALSFLLWLVIMLMTFGDLFWSYHSWQTKVAWVFILLFLPVIGIFIYWWRKPALAVA